MPIRMTEDTTEPTPAAIPAIKGGIGDVPSTLGKLFSQPALKEAQRRFLPLAKEIDSLMHGNGSVSKEQVKGAFHSVAETLIYDLDGADGKFDGKLTKSTLLKKFEKVASSSDKFGNVDTVKKQISSLLNKTKGETIDANELIQKVDAKVAKTTDRVFTVMDTDKNDIVTSAELKGMAEKIGEKLKQLRKDDCPDGQCTQFEGGVKRNAALDALKKVAQKVQAAH